MQNSVTLQTYDPLWVSEFEVERKQILAVLGVLVREIEHVGSTSISGMMAKPIIDIAVAVNSFSMLDHGFLKRLADIGYAYVPHEEFPHRRFFRRGEWGAGTHHLHVYEMNSDDWQNIIRFRNYLRDHPETAQAYMNLKIQLATVAPDRQTYTDQKAPFIRKVLSKARECI